MHAHRTPCFSAKPCLHCLPPPPCSTIPDDEAKKPEGWLDEEPAEVEDPGARLCLDA